MHNPKLSIRTSAKPSDVVSTEVASVDDLLDHTWHYDCVVSPTHSSLFKLNQILLDKLSPAKSSAPQAPNSGAQAPLNPAAPASPSRAAASRPNPFTSEYVSLASFIHTARPSPGSAVPKPGPRATTRSQSSSSGVKRLRERQSGSSPARIKSFQGGSAPPSSGD